MVFPVVMYECDSWTVKETERWRIGAFELWCWRRLLRVPGSARRSNQSIIKEGDLSWVFIGRTDVLAEIPVLWPPDVKSWLFWKDPDAGKDWGPSGRTSLFPRHPGPLDNASRVEGAHRAAGCGASEGPRCGGDHWGPSWVHTVEKGRITEAEEQVTHKSTIKCPKILYSENSSLWSYRKFILEDKVSERGNFWCQLMMNWDVS